MKTGAMGLSARVAFERGDFTLDVALEVDGVTVVMGPNGAGKTTLLRLLVGALTPSHGRIVSSGEVLFDSARGVDRPPEERRLAYVPQGFALFPHLRAIDNVAFGIRERRSAARRARALELLHDLGATDLADRYPAELSSGERQRVALARAVATEPRLLLLDEPLSALDPASRPRLRASFAAWQARVGIPALIVTHDPADAQSFAEAIVILEGGRVIQTGAPEDVAFHPASEFAATLTAGLLERPGAFHPGRRAISEDE